MRPPIIYLNNEILLIMIPVIDFVFVHLIWTDILYNHSPLTRTFIRSFLIHTVIPHVNKRLLMHPKMLLNRYFSWRNRWFHFRFQIPSESVKFDTINLTFAFPLTMTISLRLNHILWYH